MGLETIKCLSVIVDRGKAGRVCKTLTHHGLGILYVALAHGTAHSVFIDYLGLAEPEKEIVFALLPESRRKAVFGDLKRKMQLDMPGKGIAFSVGLTSVTRTALDRAGGMEEEIVEETAALDYELVVVTTEAGLSETVVEAAREAGAGGGTILNARSLCTEDVKRVLGFTLQPEREIVLLLTPREQRKTIMQAMCDCVRRETGEGTTAFSLPVSDVAGLAR